MEISTYYILNCFLSILSGLIIFLTLIFIKQRWANTLHHLMTYLLLPPIAFVITKMISNNFALSLGMIGALSIVRFRNPVKNPLELVIFFGLVTLGITYGVSRLWSLSLTLVIVLVLISCKILEIILKKTNFSPLSLSFNEEFYGNFLEINSSKNIKNLETHDNLVYYYKDSEKYIYRLSIKDRNEIEKLKEELDKINEINNIEVKIFNK